MTFVGFTHWYKAWFIASAITIGVGLIADRGKVQITLFEFIIIELVGLFCIQIILLLEDLNEINK